MDVENKLMFTGEGKGVGGINAKTGIDIQTLLYIKQVTSKDLFIVQGTLFNTLEWPIRENNLKKYIYIHIHIYMYRRRAQ